MANTIYTGFLNGQLGKATYTPVDFDGATDLKLALIDNAGADGAPDGATDDYWDDQDGSLVDSLSTALASVTVGVVAVGVVDAANMAPAFTTVSGATVESLVLLRDSGTPATSQLICFWDTGVTGLPLTPNGGDVNVDFNASGIFKI